LQEYGNAVQTTAKLRATGFLPVNPIVANVLGYNAGLSTDTIAQAHVPGRQQRHLLDRRWPHQHRRVEHGDRRSCSRRLWRSCVVRTCSRSVRPYRAIIHPDVSYDIRTAALGNTWGDPHVYSDPTGVYNGVIGAYAGATVHGVAACPLFADASNGAGSTGTVDVYGTLFMGRQAVAKGFSTGEEYGA
jgi:hypothetical protein